LNKFPEIFRRKFLNSTQGHSQDVWGTERVPDGFRGKAPLGSRGTVTQKMKRLACKIYNPEFRNTQNLNRTQLCSKVDIILLL